MTVLYRAYGDMGGGNSGYRRRCRVPEEDQADPKAREYRSVACSKQRYV